MTDEQLPDMATLDREHQKFLTEFLLRRIFWHAGTDLGEWMPEREDEKLTVKKGLALAALVPILAAQAVGNGDLTMREVGVAILHVPLVGARWLFGGTEYRRQIREESDRGARQAIGAHYTQVPTLYLLDWLVVDESSGWSEDGSTRTLSVDDWASSTYHNCIEGEETGRFTRMTSFKEEQALEVLQVVAKAITTWPMLTQEPVLRYLGRYVRFSSVPGESISCTVASTLEGLG